MRWLTLLALVAAPLAVAPPAHAHHVGTVSVAQVANDALSVTIEVDVTYTGGAGGGVFRWTTGDGGTGAVPDGTTTAGGYLGDSAGVATFAGTRPASVAMDLTRVTWRRTQPAPGVARTRLTYSYASGGAYAVAWDACCPSRTGTTPVTVDAPAAPVPVRPAGVVEIASEAGGAPTYAFSGFVPPVASWRCATTPWNGRATAVTCTPPPPPAGAVNVCGTAALVVEASIEGTVSGAGSCGSGHEATAVTGGPWFNQWADAQHPRAPFPWRCSAVVSDPPPVAWRVRCAVS